MVSEFGRITLQDRYMLPGETTPDQVFRRASYAFATDRAHAERMFHYSRNLWLTYSTPILTTPVKPFGESPGKGAELPISCYLNSVEDSIDGLNQHTVETRNLSVSGGGVGAYWGNVRSDLSEKSPGIIPFLKTEDADVLAYHQGATRRGAYAAYLDVTHPQIKEFLAIRNPTGGDANRKCLNIHHAVVVTNDFLDKVNSGDAYQLVDPHSGPTGEFLNARDIWWGILESRHQTGEPYIMNKDIVNEALPQEQKDLGLEVTQSNLCSEIVLPTDQFRTAVCCLSSLNLEHYDDWKSTQIVEDLVEFLDNVLEYFIEHSQQSNAVYSAMMERAIGIGALGFHSYLQKNLIPFESALASSFNRRVFADIKLRALAASRRLAEERGEPDDMVGSGRRNSHLLAIAPNATSSIIGDSSPSIEPWVSNVFVHKTKSGTHLVRNKALDDLIQIHGKGRPDGWCEEQWKLIQEDDGSVQDLDWMSRWEKDLFKKANEIDQHWIIDHAISRQEHICQSQSVNLFFPSNVSADYIHSVHWKAVNSLKTLYYLRSSAARRAEKVSVKVDRNFITDPEGCLSCE